MLGLVLLRAVQSIRVQGADEGRGAHLLPAGAAGTRLYGFHVDALRTRGVGICIGVPAPTVCFLRTVVVAQMVLLTLPFFPFGIVIARACAPGVSP